MLGSGKGWMDGRVGAKGNEVEKIGNMDVLIKSQTRHYGRVIGLISSLSLSAVFFASALLALRGLQRLMAGLSCSLTQSMLKPKPNI